MRALSVWQPWAWLIVNGHKDIENRTWRTTVRGPVLVHAAQRFDFDSFQAPEMARRALDNSWLFGPTFKGVELPPLAQLERGGIVGVVEIVDCVSESDSRWFEGSFGFVLANAQPLPFVPFAGKQKFFEVPDDLVRGVEVAQGSLWMAATGEKYE